MTESIGRQYETAIPALSDTANIQEAFRIYHYGVPTTEFNPTNTEPSDLEPKSIAFYLTDFQEQINDITSILSPTAYEKRGNLVVAGDDGPIVLELNPNYPTTFSENGLLLVSDDSSDSGMKWLAPSITLTNIQTISNKKLTNTTITSDGLKFEDSTALHATTVRAPTQASSKTVFLPTSAAVMPGTSTTLVGTDTTQTLTNKTISLEAASNTITGRLASTSGGTPAGVISQYAGSSAPAGYLLCQGQSVSTTTFADLFSAIGYTYGGSGSSFIIPNLQNRVPVGRGQDAEFDTLGETGGAKTHTLTTAEMPSHTHVQDSHNHTQNSHNHTQNSHNHTQNAHGHSASSGSAGSHSHTASSGTSSPGTDSQGQHSHTLTAVEARTFVNRGTGSTQTFMPLEQRELTTNFRVAHSHTVNSHSHTVSVAAGGDHSHTVSVDNATAVNQATTAVNQATTAVNQATTATNQNTGGGGAHNNLQPYIVVNYIIKT